MLFGKAFTVHHPLALAVEDFIHQRLLEVGFHRVVNPVGMSRADGWMVEVMAVSMVVVLLGIYPENCVYAHSSPSTPFRSAACGKTFTVW